MHKTNGRTTSPRVYNRHYEKVGDNEPVCIEDELPFEIPESWEWVRLGNAYNIVMGQSPNGNSVGKNCNGIEFHQGKICFGKKYLQVSEQKTTMPTKIIKEDAVVLCVRAPVGKVNIVERMICIGRGLCAVMPFISTSIEFIYLLLQTYEDIFNKKATGTTFKAISNEVVFNQIIPLPPLAEQERIVAEIEKYEPLIAEYDKLEQQKNKLDGEIYDKLKKSILQYAIQGKLVPQDERDEPASELLKRIRAEKKAQLGKKYVDSYIYKGDDNCYYEKVDSEVKNITEEIPFEIPKKWEWMRLKQIIDFSKSNSFPSDLIPNEAWILDLEDIVKDSGKVLRKKRMREVKSKSDKHKFDCGNVLYSKLRPYLNKVVVADEDGFCTSEILAFDFSPIMSEYAKVYLMSPFFVDYAMNGVYGVKMPRIGSERGNNALMPLPPLNEQKRIVQRLNEIFNKLKDEA